METVLCRKVQPLTESNLKISKTVTNLTAVKTEENIISKLKKLPDITFDLVKPEPIFKIPKVPKLEKSNTKQMITPNNKSKVVFEKKILLEKQNDNIIDKNIVIIDTIDLTNFDSNVNKTSKKKKELIDYKTPLIKNNVDQIIPQNLKSSPLKYLYSEKENKQITSSSNKYLKNICSKIKSAHLKTIKPTEQELNLSNALPVELSSDSTENTTQFKTCDFLALKSNEDYTLMNLSVTGQVNVVSASCPDFIDVSNTEYNSFLMGINKSPDYNYGMRLKTSQHFVDHSPDELLIKQDNTSLFSDPQTNPPPISTNKSKNNHSDLLFLSCSSEKNASFNYYKNEQINYLFRNNSRNNKVNCFEYENNNLESEGKFTLCSSNNIFKMPQLQINEVRNTMDKPNDYFLQGMRTYFHDYLLEEVSISENKLIDCPKFIQEILSNTEQLPSNIKSNENTNCTKRWQPQNDTYKKQKTVV